MIYRKSISGAEQNQSDLIYITHSQSRRLNSLSRNLCCILLRSLNFSLVSNGQRKTIIKFEWHLVF